MAGELQMGSYTDRCDELQQLTRYLLQYYMNGVDDPETQIIVHRLISKMYVLASELGKVAVSQIHCIRIPQETLYFLHKTSFSKLKRFV